MMVVIMRSRWQKTLFDSLSLPIASGRSHLLWSGPYGGQPRPQTDGHMRLAVDCSVPDKPHVT